MAFKLDDAGRATSKRPHQKRDCTVRSVATALTLHYDDAYKLLALFGRKCNTGFDIEAWGRKVALYDGANDRIYFRLQKMPFSKGERYGLPKSTQRYRLHDFIKDRPTGRFIVSTARHVFAVVDGVVHDDLPWHYAENRAVYSWLEVKVVRLPLWQVYALRKPIRKGGARMVKRRVAIVEGASYKLAMRVASKQYEWALKKHEDLTVEAYEDDPITTR